MGSQSAYSAPSKIVVNNVTFYEKGFFLIQCER